MIFSLTAIAAAAPVRVGLRDSLKRDSWVRQLHRDGISLDGDKNSAKTQPVSNEREREGKKER